MVGHEAVGKAGYASRETSVCVRKKLLSLLDWQHEKSRVTNRRFDGGVIAKYFNKSTIISF